MRLAILADIHANLPALEAVLSDARENRVDGFIVAGDHVNGGPHPNETIDVLRSLENCWLIRGNTDDYLLKFSNGTALAEWRTSRQWAPTRWSYQCLDQDHLDFVAALPGQCVVEWHDTTPIRVVHGTPSSSVEALFPDHDAAMMQVFARALILPRQHVPLDDAIVQVGESVLICGHSHISWKRERAGRLVINPGSVGAPINGDPRAQYAVLAWRDGRWQAEQRFVEYDIARERAAYSERGLLTEGGGMARAFLLNAETGRNIAGELLAHAYRLAADAGFPDCVVVPDAIWDHAVATFDWDAAGGWG
jgi:predicted phosphodiesterase